MTKQKGDGEHPPRAVLKFPCEFPIKVMGKSSKEFAGLVLAIVRQHFPDFTDDHLEKRYSQFTNYISLTVTVTAESREQLDQLYRHLSSTPEILVVL